MNATNEEKLTQQAREAVAKVLTEIELKLMSVYLQGLQDGMDRAKQIINGNEV
jgi:division protein CdvB (Snf7/Vps24/ESCRT-III family)